MHIKGILPPMITPFQENEEVAYDAFVRNIERWNNVPLTGYLVLGSNSETAYLNEEEKLKLAELTVQATGKDRFVLAGTGLESTRETIRFTNKVAKKGIHAALVLTPAFYSSRMTDEPLVQHFTAVADAAEVPVLLYNVPKFTHVNISANAVGVLSQHPNIIGMKDSSGDIAQLEAFTKVVRKGFNLIVGTASALYPALKLGIQAGILALANCTPHACTTMQRHFDAGEHQKGEELQARILPINRAVTDTYGIPGLKYASMLMGYEGGYARRPLLPLKDEEKLNIQKIMTEAGFIRQHQKAPVQ